MIPFELAGYSEMCNSAEKMGTTVQEDVEQKFFAAPMVGVLRP
jgi:hypothetical protein